MSTLRAIRSIRRFERIKSLVFGPLIAVCCILLVWLSFSGVLGKKSFVAIANTYAPVVNLILTIALVLITAWYAWITTRMAAEIADSRRASIRALLWLDVGMPDLSPLDGQARPTIATQFQLWNLGRGAAMAAKFRCTVPYESEKDSTSIVADVQPQPPAVLAPGAVHSANWSIFGFPTDMTSSREDFLEAQVTYQDTEGNLYELFATFDLQVIGGLLFWRLSSETLYFLPFRRRRSPREVGTVLGPATEYIQLYERRF